eukprot:gene10440-11533_t
MADVLDKKLSEILDKKLASFKAEIEITIKENTDKALASLYSKINKRLQDIEKAQQFQSDKDLENKDQQRSKAIDYLEQYGCRSMVEVSGIPRLQNENYELLMIELGNKIGIKFKQDDIEASHRNSQEEDAVIITKFASRKICDLFFKKEVKSQVKKLKAINLGFTESSDPRRFINKSLTQRNQNLIRLTKIKKRELEFKFVWTRNGNIFITKNKSPSVKKINLISDLDSLEDMSQLIITQLIITIHEIAQALDQGEQTDIILLDFQKAFDEVPHKDCWQN